MISSTNKAFTNTANTEAFLDAIKQRRTIYGIDKHITVTDERIQEIVEFLVNNVPSSFNSQSSRVKILLGSESIKFWEGTKEVLRKIVPAEHFAPTEQKMNGFAAGYGTILFFEDQNDIKTLQENFPLYASAFPTFSEHSTGMLQFATWTALEAEGLGASLQHYTPIVDELVQTQWKAPTSWRLVAQLPFGNPIAAPGEKTFKPIDQRVQVHKA